MWNIFWHLKCHIFSIFLLLETFHIQKHMNIPVVCHLTMKKNWFGHEVKFFAFAFFCVSFFLLFFFPLYAAYFYILKLILYWRALSAAVLRYTGSLCSNRWHHNTRLQSSPWLCRALLQRCWCGSINRLHTSRCQKKWWKKKLNNSCQIITL